ncbi:hypothetical protein DXO170_20255 [Xanthomonas oryzae pv. oryzae]|uniref:Uncharacterized protein n=1 Tax=Xanthomonas oryzae pv. oryzae TaxID=64187 RepID=A0A854CHS4_XANOO|nr:hypothetical protein AZ54_22315 [Xanthomonas oryzae pv. oryzae PXO86]ALZ73573.1 hypothetical protein APZ20_20935 [Xanthomonas oryzae pv. oryzae]AOS01099.1 hypothetical protein ATY42_02520 [Xanthomonas oryzae pv. oryzae]AOS08199.1 hypothetical protein ATY43_21850 [Xanthomonas oryzae pv. oryzae]AOS12381.1 hypothetical protein ATY44_21105 [Xanthomonas oryzae pv. oryzae]
MHHRIGAGDPQLGRHGDGLRILHYTIGRCIPAQQHTDRNRGGDQRIAAIAFHARRIVRQPLRLDVTIDEKVAAQRMQ